MNKVDHYSVLGVARNANKEEIRKAYKAKALIHHPDKNPEGGAAFRLVLDAYQTLSNPQTKAKYDREHGSLFRSSGATGGAFPGHNAFARASGARYAAGTAAQATPNTETKPQFATDEQLFNDAYQQYKKSVHREYGSFGAANEGSFSDWFKKKQEEVRRTEEQTRMKAEAARSVAQEQQKKDEEWRRLQKEREKKREEELRHERLLREWEREEARRKQEDENQLKREEQRRVLIEETNRIRMEQQIEIERHLKDLAAKKHDLEEERRALASEREKAAAIAEENRASRREIQKQREAELAAEVRRAEQKMRDANVAKAYADAAEKIREQERLNEEKKRRAEEERRLQEFIQEEAIRKENEAAENEARRLASIDLAEKRKRVLLAAEEERNRHQEECAEIRRETDRIEADMRAKLEALRQAKASGMPINLDEWKL